jgi:hypothetical protein
MNTKTPIACNLSEIEDDKIEDHKENAEAFFGAISKAREIVDGYSFRLPADTDAITKAGTFIARERLCCPFFEFSITVQAEQQPVWLTLTGREAVKPYIKETLLPKLDAPVETLN